MNNRVEEVACWRLWYRLQVKGPLWENNLMANCGIQSEVFDNAIDALVRMGMVEEVDHDYQQDRCRYDLVVEEPRMMQVYPTIHNEEQ